MTQFNSMLQKYDNVSYLLINIGIESRIIFLKTSIEDL